MEYPNKFKLKPNNTTNNIKERTYTKINETKKFAIYKDEREVKMAFDKFDIAFLDKFIEYAE